VLGTLIRAVKRANHRFISILAFRILSRENRPIIRYPEYAPNYDRDGE
jgi:hypothetical protein